ncbi:MAG: hypothetical protein Q7T74_00105 [Candidatus Saccharibacteria bacterium]|nr:hypothetical protein [Candidatus Saccharibacteria bacterium]
MNIVTLRRLALLIVLAGTCLLIQAQNLDIRRSGGVVGVAAGSGITIVTNSGVVTVSSTSGGLTNTFNTGQFTLMGGTNVNFKSEALTTNLVSRGSGGEYSIAIGDGVSASGSFSVSVGPVATASGAGALSIGSTAGATQYQASAFGASSLAGHSNSTAIGQSATTTAANQIRLGTATETVSIPGALAVTGNATANSGYVTNALTNGVFFSEWAPELTYSDATNVVINCTNYNGFHLLVTNTTYISVTNIPSKLWTAWLDIEQNGTGGFAVTFNTNYIAFAAGTAPTITTNANKMDNIGLKSNYRGTNVSAFVNQNFQP